MRCKNQGHSIATVLLATILIQLIYSFPNVYRILGLIIANASSEVLAFTVCNRFWLSKNSNTGKVFSLNADNLALTVS